MGSKKHFSWMVRPKGFIRLIGAEYELMERAGGNVLLKFYLSSMIIVTILLITFLSIYYGVDLLFHVQAIEIILSVFFSVLFVFIYIFLLNTFTKKEVSSKNKLLQLSNFIRIGFVVFMAFIISKPIEIYFFDAVLEKEVAQHKQHVLQEHQKRVDTIFYDDLKRLFDKANYYQSITGSENALGAEMNAVNERIDEIKSRKHAIMAVAAQRVASSSFFVYRIRQLAKNHPVSYLISLFVVILFVLPGFIIYNISEDDAYYKLKTDYEDGLISRTYQAFLKQYGQLSLKHFGCETEFYTVYEDPPYNTKRKSDKNYEAETEFFKKYR